MKWNITCNRSMLHQGIFCVISAESNPLLVVAGLACIFQLYYIVAYSCVCLFSGNLWICFFLWLWFVLLKRLPRLLLEVATVLRICKILMQLLGACVIWNSSISLGWKRQEENNIGKRNWLSSIVLLKVKVEWEANICLNCKAVPLFLWNPKVLYYVKRDHQCSLSWTTWIQSTSLYILFL
jgi:hypothetical protein